MPSLQETNHDVGPEKVKEIEEKQYGIKSLSTSSVIRMIK